VKEGVCVGGMGVLWEGEVGGIGERGCMCGRDGCIMGCECGRDR